jgi:hypothetical protein
MEKSVQQENHSFETKADGISLSMGDKPSETYEAEVSKGDETDGDFQRF